MSPCRSKSGRSKRPPHCTIIRELLDEFPDRTTADEFPDRPFFDHIPSNSTLLGSICKGTAWLDDRVTTTWSAMPSRGETPKSFRKIFSILLALRKPTSAVALATGQFACITAMHTYEFCNRASSSNSARIQACQLHNTDFKEVHNSGVNELDQWFQDFVNNLPPILSDLRNVSTSTFVLSGMAWTTLAMLQHHINQRDRFQRSAVMIGLVAGFAMCLPSLSRPEEQQVIASVMAFCVTVAMFVSAYGHCMSGIVSGKKRVELQVEDGDENGKKDVQKYLGVEKENV